jgi:hypothetical protein
MSDYPRKPVYIRAVSLENVPSRERKSPPTDNLSPAPASQPVISVLPENRSGRRGGIRLLPSADDKTDRAGNRRTATSTSPE